MKVSVTTQPQAIYPDGLQDDLVISNEGPSTVWLGSDTSTSIGQSMPLAPLASVHWGRGRGLWVVTDSTADLRIERAIASPVSDSARQIKRVLPISTTTENPPNFGRAGTYEVGAYASIRVDFPVALAGGVDPHIYTALFVAQVTWLDRPLEAGGIALNYYDVCFSPDTVEELANFVRTVESQYVHIQFVLVHQDTVSMSMEAPIVYGSTIPIPERAGANQSDIRWDSAGPAIALEPVSGQRYATLLLNGAQAYETGLFFIPSLGQRCTLSFRMIAAASTSASTVQILTRAKSTIESSGIYYYESLAAGFLYHRIEFWQPPGEQTYLDIGAKFHATSNVRMTCIWSD